MLVEEDLPAAYTAMSDDMISDVDPGATGDKFDSFNVEPAICGVLMKTMLRTTDVRAIAEQAAVRIFTSSSVGLVIQAIAPTDLLEGIAVPDDLSNECANVTMTMPDGSTTKASTTELDVGSYGESTTAFLSELSIDVNGQTISFHSVSAYVEGTSAGMMLALTAPPGTTEGDDLTTQLTELLEKAYSKAEPVLG